MAHIVILGAGTGGTAAAFGLRDVLGKEHRVTLINASETFQFIPSHPWVALGWRKREDTSFNLRPCLETKGITFIARPAERIDADSNCIHLANGETVDYDYLVIATGPRAAFDLIEGAGPDAPYAQNAGHTQSICTLDHACAAYDEYENFISNPGPVVVGAFQGASSFCAAYEYALVMDTDLRRRNLRHKVPITFVSPEPFIGHLGLGGVGNSQNLLESELRERNIKWITNAMTVKVEAGRMYVEEYNDQGGIVSGHALEFKYAMLMPPFRGVNAVAGVEGLCNSAGLVIVDEHQRSTKYRNIFSSGVCIAIAPLEQTPVPVGTPNTGYMIESMAAALVNNIRDELDGKPATATSEWNTVCIADMGDSGAAFVAMPQIPPRNVNWAKKGKWVHLAKIAYEKYSLRKMKTGSTELIYDKYILKALGVDSLVNK